MTRITSRFIGMIAATAIISFMLAAQPQRMTPQEQADRLAKELSLTKAQSDSVLSIFTGMMDSMKKVRDENQGDRDAMRAAMTKVRQETDDQMKKVLTAEQFDQYTKLRAQRMGGRNGGGQGGMAPQPKADSTQKAAPTPKQ